jgi:hypothetical protein
MGQQVTMPNLYTQNAYAIKINRSRQRVHQMVKNNLVKTVKINGATLIILE